MLSLYTLRYKCLIDCYCIYKTTLKIKRSAPPHVSNREHTKILKNERFLKFTLTNCCDKS